MSFELICMPASPNHHYLSITCFHEIDNNINCKSLDILPDLVVVQVLLDQFVCEDYKRFGPVLVLEKISEELRQKIG